MSHDNYIIDAIELQDKDLVIDAVITQNNVKTFRVSKKKDNSNP